VYVFYIARLPFRLVGHINETTPQLCSVATNYILPHLRTKLGERAFSYTGPQAWNAVPENIRRETSPDCLKHELNSKRQI